ncbi:hypothetical protein M8312_06500 [Sphingomonas sp. KRR8]|jgi:hypothetical protein|uniref:hypothetical protein n=1 Tax=Sphingomonas sp. KRR8 TaxID=2942996 RepID=UPI00202095D0|nr:hypothetical protein [Sphingomonas sp. KRR8]URD62149.1 hypothetical protein M8312_06500 [Sphingomonas sp. KRR8]
MMILALFLATAAPVTQGRAVALVSDAMKRIDPTTPLVCLSITPEKTSSRRFDITVREVHDYKCGGDDEVETVRDRFRVTRLPVSVSRLDAAKDRYIPCTISKGAVTCPAPTR